MKHITRKFMIIFHITAAAVLGQFCFAGQFIEKVTVTKSDCHFFFLQELRPLALLERGDESKDSATNAAAQARFAQSPIAGILWKMATEFVEDRLRHGEAQIVIGVKDGNIIEGELLSSPYFVNARVWEEDYPKGEIVQILREHVFLFNKFMHGGKITFLGREHTVVNIIDTPTFEIEFDTGRMSTGDVINAILLNEIGNQGMGYELCPGGWMVYILDGNRIIRYEEYYPEEEFDRVTVAKFVNSQKVGEVTRKKTYMNDSERLFALGPKGTMGLYDVPFLEWRKVPACHLKEGGHVSMGSVILALRKTGQGLVLEDLDGQQWPLKEGPNILGRSGDGDICIKNMTVSDRHAEITVTGNEVSVKDLNSKNGILVPEPPAAGGEIMQRQDKFRTKYIMAIIIEDAVALAKKICGQTDKRAVFDVSARKEIWGKVTSFDSFFISIESDDNRKIKLPILEFLILNKYVKGGKIYFLGHQHDILSIDSDYIKLDGITMSLLEAVTGLLLTEAGEGSIAFQQGPGGGFMFVLKDFSTLVCYDNFYDEETHIFTLRKTVNGVENYNITVPSMIMPAVAVLQDIGASQTEEYFDAFYEVRPRVVNKDGKEVTYKGALMAGSQIKFGPVVCIMHKQQNGDFFLERTETEACYELKIGLNKIGRKKGNDIVIEDPGVSRSHAVLIREPGVGTGGAVYVYDWGSKRDTILEHNYSRLQTGLRKSKRIYMSQI